MPYYDLQMTLVHIYRNRVSIVEIYTLKYYSQIGTS